MNLTYFLLIFSLHVMLLAAAQLDVFALPQAPRYAAKPTVPPEYRKYFELEDHARGLIESVIGPRPGGFFPPKSYEIGRPARENSENDNAALNEVERSLEQFLSAPSGFSQQLPPGFNQGFSVANGGNPIASFSNVRKHPVCEYFICATNTFLIIFFICFS